jgi:hypothetical protein
MKIVSNASGKSTIVKFPIDSNGTTLVSGALLTMGVTAASNMGALIVSGAAAADAVGILLGPDFPAAANGAIAAEADSTIEDGAVRTLREVELLHPGDIVAVEYDLADTVALASGSTTTGVVTSSDEETGCWHYFTAGGGIGQLAYIKSYSTDTATYKSALTTDPSTSSPFLIRIVAPGRTLVKLTTNASKLGTDAGEGTADVLVLKNEFTYDGAPGWMELDYVKHHNLQLNGLNPKFRALLCFTNCALSPIA